MNKLSLPLKVGLLGAASLTAYSALVYALQPRMLYMARSFQDFGAGDYYAELKRRLGRRLVDVAYQSASGHQHIARYIRPAVEEDVHLWVCFGGNAMLSLDFIDLCTIFQKDDRFHRTAFLLLDYPGYGENTGRPSPESILDSSTKAFEAVSKKFTISKVSALGVSLGCSVALQFCNSLSSGQSGEAPEIHSIVLCCPFSSILDIGKHHRVIPRFFPRWLSTALVRNECHWDNVKAQRELLEQHLAGIPLQLTYVHGTHDEICPMSMSEKLYGHATAIKSVEHTIQFHKVPNCDHNSLLNLGLSEIRDAMLLSRI